jgi:hypothetical protein
VKQARKIHNMLAFSFVSEALTSFYMVSSVTSALYCYLWFSPGIAVSSTNKTDRHNIAEMLLKVALKTIKP